MGRVALLLTAIATLGACAQVPPPPPAPPFMAFRTDLPETALPDPAQDAAAIRARAAEQGYALDDDNLRSNLIQLFATRARRAALPGFNEVWIDWRDEHGWINVGTSAPADRAAYLAMAAPEIRDAIRFRRTLFDRAGTDAAVARLARTFGPESGVCTLAYDHYSDWFEVGIEENADESAIRAMLPADLAPYVRIARGTCPIPV